MDQQKTKGVLLLLALVFLTGSILSQEIQVDRDELTSIGEKSIDFINYVGPYEFINTLDQIREIGQWLGTRIDVKTRSEASLNDKYRVLHIVSPEIAEGLDADVFILEEDAAVDHIVNLRTILAGYLESAYDLGSRNAYLIAEFVTYYNAVHRGSAAVLEERYKAPVREAAIPSKIGLDLHYSNWPGKTQILIPLRGGNQSSKVDMGAISGQEVIEEMREQEDMGLEARKNMVELREEELDQEQAELDKRSEELDKQSEALAEELKDIQDKEEEGAPLPDEVARKEQLEEDIQAVEEEKQVVEKAKEEIEKRVDEVMEMRDDIAEDRNVLISAVMDTDTTQPPAPVKPVWFLTVDDDGEGIPFGRVVKYDMANSKNLKVSSLTAVRGRTVILLQDGLIVIAGKTGGNSKVRPMLLDRDTLEITKEGRHDVFPGSLITMRDEHIFLVTTENGEWRLGKFSKTLDRIAVNNVAIEPWTSIFFEEDSLFVQGADGGVLDLSIEDLQEQNKNR
ncbi:MAG: hypothetical protein B6D68_00270 [spirochete symbiont of Stewartia floridana]|nr:MAG: hypothetical protein B6D68_00270 [spirochete symbiont of Stewartia floridana]